MLKDFLENNNTVFHIHIPRTAGSTLNSFFSKEENFINGHHSFNERFLSKGRVSVYNPNKKGYFCNYMDTGFKPNMKKVSLVRNPYNWLYSYYKHSGTYFRFLKYSGWQGVNTFHKFNSYSEFLENYLDKDFDWHIPLLQQSQIGQLYNVKNKKYEYDLLIISENLDSYLGETFPDRKVNKINVNIQQGQEYKYSKNEIKEH